MTATESIPVFGTTFQNPVLLAAGTAGFGREVWEVIEVPRLGGIVTKAVSPEPRYGNPPPRVAEFPGGMLNSVGLANPGLERVKNEELPWLAERLGPAKLLVNVVGFTPDDYPLVVSTLSDVEAITAFELNVSCPNTERGGEEFGADPDVLEAVVRSSADVTDRPIVVKLAPTLADLEEAATRAARAGAAGFSLVNTIPGMLYREQSVTPRLGAPQAGVSGPLLLPVGLAATRKVAAATGKPVIGVGGIRSWKDARQYLEVGAVLVAVGTAALADPRVPRRIASAWEADKRG